MKEEGKFSRNCDSYWRIASFLFCYVTRQKKGKEMPLKLIQGTAKKKSRKLWYMEKYSINGFKKFTCFKETKNRYDLCSACLYFIKYFNLSQNQTETGMKLFSEICYMISLLTPKEFLRTFPPRKNYKGARYESIDYFSTMEKFQGMNMDISFLESSTDIMEFMQGYDNREILRFSVQSMMLISKLHQQRTGRDMLDDFMISQNKEPLMKYHLHTDSKGKRFLLDNKGHSIPARKKFPRYLQVVKD